MVSAAYRFVLAHPGVTTVLGGFSSPQQVDDAVAAASAPPLTPALLALASAANAEEIPA
jgi:L-glyceraldehyde 3-phosphate reductase